MNTERAVGVEYREVGDDVGQRVDNYLLRELAGVPRSRIYRMLRKGEARVNGRRTKPDYRLCAGDVVRLPPWRPARDSSAEPAPPRESLTRLEKSILFEDEDLLVLDKPSGMAVHGGSGIAFGAIEVLRALRPSETRLELVHRLDRDTSGCLLFAKNRRTLTSLHAAFREGRVRKRYEVVVDGTWPARLRTVQLPLRRYVTRSGERRVTVDRSGKTARTEFAVSETNAGGTRLSAHPHTGRTHQIRVHCLASGHPIVGDEKYAADDQLVDWRGRGIKRLALHARSLKVPWQPRDLRFDAPVPDDFEALWRNLRTTEGHA